MYSLKNEEELKLYKCLVHEQDVVITMRGGAWFYASRYLRSAYRGKTVLATQDYDLSFRCVRIIQ